MSRPKGISPSRDSLHSLLNSTNDSLELNQIIHEYGVGVDCHSKFYYCAVWMIEEGEVKKFDFEFGVTRKEIEEAKKIVLDTLGGSINGFTFVLDLRRRKYIVCFFNGIEGYALAKELLWMNY